MGLCFEGVVEEAEPAREEPLGLFRVTVGELIGIRLVVHLCFRSLVVWAPGLTRRATSAGHDVAVEMDSFAVPSGTAETASAALWIGSGPLDRGRTPERSKQL